MSNENRKVEVPAWALALMGGLIGGGAGGSALTSMGGTNRLPEVLARQEVIISKLDSISTRLADHEQRLRILEQKPTASLKTTPR